jgi:hypothetical protein
MQRTPVHKTVTAQKLRLSQSARATHPNSVTRSFVLLHHHHHAKQSRPRTTRSNFSDSTVGFHGSHFSDISTCIIFIPGGRKQHRNEDMYELNTLGRPCATR